MLDFGEIYVNIQQVQLQHYSVPTAQNRVKQVENNLCGALSVENFSSEIFF